MEKNYVRSLFDSIAHRYDLLNHLLSGGIDMYWRRRAIDQLQDLRPERILDVACGTGDFSIAALRLRPRHVTGIDISRKMLLVGREKLRRRGFDRSICLEEGDAEALRFESQSFDAVTVGFGVRNFENLRKGLSELHRVTRRGGRVIILEFSRPRSFPFKHLYFFYFKRILPRLGSNVSQHPEAYSYLRDSVLRFPEGADFLSHLGVAGFEDLKEKRLTFGIATIYQGTATGSQ